MKGRKKLFLLLLVLADYIRDTLGGEVGEEYADPYGQGRIVFLEPEE